MDSELPALILVDLRVEPATPFPRLPQVIVHDLLARRCRAFPLEPFSASVSSAQRRFLVAAVQQQPGIMQMLRQTLLALAAMPAISQSSPAAVQQTSAAGVASSYPHDTELAADVIWLIGAFRNWVAGMGQGMPAGRPVLLCSAGVGAHPTCFDGRLPHLFLSTSVILLAG